MAYKLEAGDEVRMTLLMEGEEQEVMGRVKYNGTNKPADRVMGEPKVKIIRGTGRSSEVILLFNDGTAKKKPRFNSNGQSVSGTVKGLKLVSVLRHQTVSPDGDKGEKFAHRRDALEATQEGGHIESVLVPAEKAGDRR